ncbi:MFS general substrate transporter [Apiospora phragmitis]|uniref:MFS general substrate transporter n=1 Tax=Apiospora phragmitis TaxID=2905665 RepID=A0ABR1VXL5_9PEZI
MAFHLQSTIFGQLVRLVSRGKLFQYPDERDPSLWKGAVQRDDEAPGDKGNEGRSLATPAPSPNYQGSTPHPLSGHNVLVVGWYGPKDPENPQNWPVGLKHLIAFQLCLLNFAVYIASSIYVPGEASLMAEFGVSDIVATLGLSLFTLGYGFGPMLWSPLSEMPKIGRSGIFFWTLFAFLLLQLPVGFAPNVAIFLVFRWLTGFCGSPCLSTGGGTITDIYHPTAVPSLLCIWASAGICGPVFGPIIGGYLAPAKGWRWTIWVFTWMCVLVLLTMFFLFPETSAASILYQRARRLRKAMGNDRLRSQSEVDAAKHHTPKDTLVMLGCAFTLTFGEPVILLVDLYAGLLYGVLFRWFESFPLVYGDIYHFSSGQQGLVFLGIFVFAALTVPLFLLWTRLKVVPKMRDGSFVPEHLLPPTFIGCFALPVCLFWFGWGARPGVHWVVSVLGSGLFSVGMVTLFNSIYNYVGIAYARDAASVFAGAALFRASFGATFPLFARSLFGRLGIGPGNSLLGGIAVLFIPVPFVFYHRRTKLVRVLSHLGAWVRWSPIPIPIPITTVVGISDNHDRRHEQVIEPVRPSSRAADPFCNHDGNAANTSKARRSAVTAQKGDERFAPPATPLSCVMSTTSVVVDRGPRARRGAVYLAGTWGPCQITQKGSTG